MKGMNSVAKIFFDAASKGNPGVSTYGIAIVEGNERATFTGVLDEMDNHSAEWEALILALKEAQTLNVDNALIHTDSKLIEISVNNEYVKNPKFKHYLSQYFALADTFALCFIKWVPRKQNKEANHLAQSTLYKATNEK